MNSGYTIETVNTVSVYKWDPFTSIVFPEQMMQSHDLFDAHLRIQLVLLPVEVNPDECEPPNISLSQLALS